MSIGLRIYTERQLPPKDIIEAFRKLPTAPVADCMNRLNVMSPQIRLMSKGNGNRMCGCAMTVKVPDGDNLMIHQAIDMAGSGDVIIVSNGNSDRNRSLMGQNMFLFARSRSIEGIVLDGPIRDYDAVKNLDWYIYATGTTPWGPYKNGPGEINVPIACGGAVVNPGDIVLGDEDGIVVIPRQDAEALLKIAIPFAEADAEKAEAALKGESNREWVAKSIEAKRVEIINGYYR